MSEPAPEDTPLVVTVESVARRLRLPTPLDADDELAIADAIRDATADVEAYLGRPIVPVQVIEKGLWPWPDGWRLHDDDVIAVLSAVPEEYDDGSLSGTFTVTYTAGLDARTDLTLEPIRRYIRVAAMNSPEVLRIWAQRTSARGAVTSLSTDGQAVTFSAPSQGGGGAAGSGAPGAVPALDSLFPWRKVTVYQRRTSYVVDGFIPWWW